MIKKNNLYTIHVCDKLRMPFRQLVQKNSLLKKALYNSYCRKELAKLRQELLVIIKKMDSIGSSDHTEFKQHIEILLHRKDQLQSMFRIK